MYHSHNSTAVFARTVSSHVKVSGIDTAVLDVGVPAGCIPHVHDAAGAPAATYQHTC
jgi:hypothetical protein